MTDAESYVRNLKSIGDSIKRYSSQLKELKEKKKLAEQRLYNYMNRNNLEEYGGYKKAKLAPKERKPVKKPAEKKSDAMKLFSDTGISDPELFWEAFQSTQKPAPPNEDDHFH